jgi:hypothetical protein
MGRHKGYTHEDYRRLAAEGMSMSAAARALGVTQQSVALMAKKHGITFQLGKAGRPPKQHRECDV